MKMAARQKVRYLQTNSMNMTQRGKLCTPLLVNPESNFSVQLRKPLHIISLHTYAPFLVIRCIIKEPSFCILSDMVPNGTK